jgi:orotidine-5'-phosphate decarboxylase
MSFHFADALLDSISRKGSPICVGIDPIYEMFPDAIAGPATERDPADLDRCIDAIFDFTVKVLRILAPLVPVVKFQSAYFERYLWEGVEAYYELIHEAKELGLLVIGDVKRGDIGSTSEAYAAAHLAPVDFTGMDETTTPDAITINPFLGLDSIEPFVSVARDTGRGLFVLVRTSNPGSADLQDVKTSKGPTFSELLASRLQPVAAAPGMIGRSGYSVLGAVVGATQAHTMRALRDLLPQSIFLLPGYGTQGATAEMTRAAFRDGKGAIVSASRSILYAHQKSPTKPWEDVVRHAVETMREQITSIA